MIILPPGPNVHFANATACWDNAFADAELQSIIASGELNCPQQATVGSDNSVRESYRDSDVCFIEPDPWLTSKLVDIATRVNNQFFGFDLHGFGENFQYTRYADTGQKYDWHIDAYLGGSSDTFSTSPRKLSMVLMLSDPTDFDGGELQIKVGKGTETLEQKKGRIWFFPSFILHRVTPVTKGTRHTLVAWICGKAFR